ncbi:hypothetical protein [Zavarzinella formosa]|uniref:hypothetical protein n=1 Tax=Zavarzinella formosa TaxID=360055 RepID=UPI0002E826C1|nr:hypothetical protein [Zavarzinella formosa]
MTRFITKKTCEGEYAVHRPGERLVVAEISKVAHGHILLVRGVRVGDYHATLADAKALIQPVLEEMRVVA